MSTYEIAILPCLPCYQTIEDDRLEASAPAFGLAHVMPNAALGRTLTFLNVSKGHFLDLIEERGHTRSRWKPCSVSTRCSRSSAPSTGDQRPSGLLPARSNSAPPMADLKAWLTAELAKLSRNHDLATACLYMLRRWEAFTRFLDDGRICLTNNATERALRCVPIGRKAWLFCGSDRGGERAAVLYTLIQTARLNDVDPQAWLADVLARIVDHPISRLEELLPWHWQPYSVAIAA
jgi:hypothetical protein